MKPILPVILGSDLGGLSLAQAFHARFGSTSVVLGTYACGITRYSPLCKIYVEPRLKEPNVACGLLLGLARRYPGHTLVLVPAADAYVALSMELAPALADSFTLRLPERSVWQQVKNKASFAALAKAHGLPIPRTVVLGAGGELPQWQGKTILKPADSAAYYAHPFFGMQKVYENNSLQNVKETMEKITKNGYDGLFVLQEKIEVEHASTLTLLIREDGTLYAGAVADVVLEERGDGSRGNYAALLTRPPDALCHALVRFALELGYRGVCNFDLLYDRQGGYVLELNPRQGRSCGFLQGAGVDLAGFLAGCPHPRSEPFVTEAFYFHALPHKSVLSHATDPSLLLGVRQCVRERRAFGPFFYPPDHRGLLRRGYVLLHGLRRTRAVRREGRPRG